MADILWRVPPAIRIKKKGLGPGKNKWRPARTLCELTARRWHFLAFTKGKEIKENNTNLSPHTHTQNLSFSTERCLGVALDPHTNTIVLRAKNMHQMTQDRHLLLRLILYLFLFVIPFPNIFLADDRWSSLLLAAKERKEVITLLHEAYILPPQVAYRLYVKTDIAQVYSAVRTQSFWANTYSRSTMRQSFCWSFFSTWCGNW